MGLLALSMTALRLYYQRKSRLEGGEFHLQEGGVSLAFGSAAALTNIVFGLAFLLRPRAWRKTYFRAPAPLRWLGVIGSVLGQLLLWASHHHLAANFSGVVGLRDEQQLVDTGPYNRIRHPIYTAYLLNYASGGLVAGSWVLTFIPAALYCAMAAIRMPQEERLLRRTFGERYAEYLGRTGRLLPRIR
jgi:protein-S-isoprenylcysteine O-methyltransferase Ste14